MPPTRDSSIYQPVSSSFSLEDLSESRNEVASVLTEGSETHLVGSNIHGTLDPGGRTTFGIRANDLCLLAGILVMLSWPWIFLATIWSRGGVQMNDYVVKVIRNHPQRTNFFITFLGNIVSILISVIFSTSVVRFSQEWTTNNDHVTVFDVSLISAFRLQNWPWRIKDHKYLPVRNRWLLVILAGACIAAFTLVPPGTTSLITPVSFNRTWPLTETELDFSSNVADDCIDWFATNRLPERHGEACDWKSLNDLRYPDCLGPEHTVDVLESGRSSIQWLFSNNSESRILGQFGANSSLRFLGPTHGALPIGPNGIRGLGALQRSPLSDAGQNAAILSYNYTFDHQGLTSNISCMFDPESPIEFSAMPNNTLFLEAKAPCNDIGLADVLLKENYPTLNTSHTLTFWACKSIPTGEQDPSYYVYLRGSQDYEAGIGNISCTVSPIQPAIFPVTYQSRTGFFSTEPVPITSSPPANIFFGVIERAISGLGDVIQQSQTIRNNLVAASIEDLECQALGLSPYERNEQKLLLYEAMIRGILVDQITYLRFLHSTVSQSPLPAYCIRRVNGIMSAEVTGWVAKPVHIAFLTPMTILNLASLIIALISIARAKVDCHEFDPTDPGPLLLAEPSFHESDDSGWTDSVSYRSRESVIFQRSTTKNATE